MQGNEILLIISISLVIISLSLVFRLITVRGKSMEDTVIDGERVLVSRIIYRIKQPKRGDIIIIKKENLSRKYLIKRVIAVSEDMIEIKNNNVYINEAKIQECYIKEVMNTKKIKLKVPKGKIFVMGDNRNNSIDSRCSEIGLIDIKNEIEGKVIFSVSLLKKIQ